MIDESEILTKLNTLLSTITNVQEVYEGMPVPLETYPSIVIVPGAWEEEYADLRDTTVMMSFQIGVYVSLTPDALTAQSTLRTLVKAVREILGDQANITLDGLIDSSRLTSGQYDFDQKELKMAYCTLNYNVRKRFSRFS